MKTLPVNEIFETVQGEGHHVGRPSVFIRLQGCPVGCPWCDTKFTWELDPHAEITEADMQAKRASGEPTHALLTHEQTIRHVLDHHAMHTVITGGEPAMHDLILLTYGLHNVGRTSQIETSGTYPIKVSPQTWVTVSPKISMPGGLAIRPDAMRRADEIKMPVGKLTDIDALLRLLDKCDIAPDTALIYLQPISRSEKATELCTQQAIKHNWRVSIQTHLLAGWR